MDETVRNVDRRTVQGRAMAALTPGQIVDLYRCWSEYYHAASFLSPVDFGVERFITFLKECDFPGREYEDHELDLIDAYRQRCGYHKPLRERVKRYLRNGPDNVKDMAVALGVSAITLNTTLHRMARMGIVHRIDTGTWELCKGAEQ